MESTSTRDTKQLQNQKSFTLKNPQRLNNSCKMVLGISVLLNNVQFTIQTVVFSFGSLVTIISSKGCRQV